MLCTLFSISSYGYVDEDLRSQINRTSDSIVYKYYYTNPDTIFSLLQPVLKEAGRQKLWDQCLYINLNFVSVAQEIDSLKLQRQYLDECQAILNSHQQEIARYDSTSYMQSYFIFFNARFYYNLLDYQQAMSTYSRIFELTSESLDSLLAFNTHINIGNSAYNLGDYEKSRHHFALAKQVLPRTDPTYAAGRGFAYKSAFIDYQLGRSSFFKARVVDSEKEYQSALSQYHKALYRLLPMADKKYSWNLLNTVLQHLANCHYHLNNMDSAIWYVEKLFDQPVNSVEDEIHADLLAGKIYSDALSFDQAKLRIDKAIDFASKQLGAEHAFVGRALHLKGKWHYKQDHSDSSLHYFDAAKPYFASSDYKGTLKVIHEGDLLELYESYGDVYQQLGAKRKNTEDYFQALEQYRQAVSLSEEMRKSFISAESQQFLAAEIYDIFEKGISILYHIKMLEATSDDWIDMVLFFFEKNRGLQLAEANKGLEGILTHNLPEKMVARERKLKGEIAFYKRKLNAEDEGEKYRKVLDKAYNDYEHLQDSMRQQFPKYYQWLYASKLPEMSGMQAQLSNDEVLVSYYWGKRNVYALVIDQQSYELLQLGSTDEIKQQLDALLNHLHSPPDQPDVISEDLLDNSRLLYEQVFAPIEQLLSSDLYQIYLIADGPLGYLPFEALVRKYEGDDIDWLMNSNYFSYHSSIQLFLNSSHERSGNIRKLAYLGMAPDYQLIETLNFKDKRRDMGVLAHNQEEVQEVNKLMKGTIFTGSEATESNFSKYAPESDIIHLSLHAGVDQRYPNYSAMYFIDQKRDEELSQIFELDGILHLYELYGYQLPTSLAVLSACETGYGNWAKGEGIISLGRAFQYAGCPSVAMSLWKVSDRSTNEIMQKFFRYLNEGMDKHKALTNAKVDFIQDPKNKYFQHPYYWSAFVIQGDTSPLVSRSIAVWWGLLVLVAIIAGVALRRSKKRS